MTEPFISQIKIFAFGFAPRGWAPCDGRLLPINQYQALFSLLGPSFGGDGVTNFALPDLRGRSPISLSPQFALGTKGGEETHTLTVDELPMHAHPATGTNAGGTDVSPANQAWATSAAPRYGSTPDTSMAPEAIAPGGGGGAHENEPPFLVLSFCIALQGIYPSQN